MIPGFFSLYSFEELVILNWHKNLFRFCYDDIMRKPEWTFWTAHYVLWVPAAGSSDGCSQLGCPGTHSKTLSFHWVLLPFPLHQGQHWCSTCGSYYNCRKNFNKIWLETWGTRHYWETVEGVLGACHSEVVKGKEGNRLEALSLLVSKGGVSRVSWFSLVLSRFTELKGVSGCRKLEGRVSYTGAHTSTWMLSTLCWVGDSKTDKSSATSKTPSLQHGAWVQSVCLNSFRETKWTTARMW